MVSVVKKLGQLQARLGVLKGLIDRPEGEAVHKTVDDITLTLERITNSALSSLLKTPSKEREAVTCIKQIVLSRVKTTLPQWAVLDRPGMALDFFQMAPLSSNTVQMKCRVRIGFKWSFTQQDLVLTCSSRTMGMNTQLRTSPEAVLENVLALLRCFQECSVFLSRDRDRKDESSDEMEVDDGFKIKREPHVSETEEDDHCDDATDESSGYHLQDNPQSFETDEEGVVADETAVTQGADDHISNILAREFAGNEVPSIKIEKNEGKEVKKREAPDRKSQALIKYEFEKVSPDKAANMYLRCHKRLCRLCNKAVDVMSGLNHLKELHQIQSIECCFCPTVFDSESQMNHHLKKHVALELPCRFCDKEISPKSGAKHMAAAHPEQKFACCFCPRGCGTKDALKSHLQLYHVFRILDRDKLRPCKTCAVQLTRIEEGTHMMMEHDKPEECPLCDYHAGQDSGSLAVQTMVRVSEGIRAEDLVMRHIKVDHREKSRFCNYCHEDFKTRELAAEHRTNCIVKEELKARRRLCIQCGKEVAWFSWGHHKMTCGGNERFACALCPKKYGKGANLKKHLISAHFPEQKKHVCSECGKAFPRPDYLKRHQEHHGRPTIKCTRAPCEKMFKTRRNVLQHITGEM